MTQDFSKEIDCMYKDEVVCPHCGYEFSESHEFSMQHDGDEIEIECDECGKPFTAFLCVEYTYSTHKEIKKK
jgi:uncharacterized Zn finger protein